MINGLEGIPGSGKSYEATVYHVLHALANGRMVITNLPLIRDKFMAIDPAYGALIQIKRRCSPILGTWDANRMDDEGNGNAFELFADAHQEPADVTQSVFGGVWDYYTTWKHSQTGQGPLFVIDECHVALPRIGTSKSVIEWYKLHRHFNVDVLLMTQSFRDMEQSIARLLEMLVRCRKASFLGKPNKYIRKVYAGYRGAVISTEERPYKSQYFGLYKSHTQGNAVAESLASDVKPFLVKFRRWSWAVIALGLILFIGVIYNATHKKPQPTVTKTVTVEGDQVKTVTVVTTPPSVATPPGLTASERASAASQTRTESIPEPYETKGFHLMGRMTMGDRTIYMLAVSQNGINVSTVTHKELERAGYRFVSLTDCAATLFWQERAIPVTCDLPQINQGVGPSPGAGRSDGGAHGTVQRQVLNDQQEPRASSPDDLEALQYLHRKT